MDYVLNRMERAIILSENDIAHLKQYIGEKYADFTGAYRAEVLADSIRRVVGKNLEGLEQSQKDVLQRSLFKNTLAKNQNRISKKDVFAEIASLEMTGSAIYENALRWAHINVSQELKLEEVRSYLKKVSSPGTHTLTMKEMTAAADVAVAMVLALEERAEAAKKLAERYRATAVVKKPMEQNNFAEIYAANEACFKELEKVEGVAEIPQGDEFALNEEFTLSNVAEKELLWALFENPLLASDANVNLGSELVRDYLQRKVLPAGVGLALMTMTLVHGMTSAETYFGELEKATRTAGSTGAGTALSLVVGQLGTSGAMKASTGSVLVDRTPVDNTIGNGASASKGIETESMERKALEKRALEKRALEKKALEKKTMKKAESGKQLGKKIAKRYITALKYSEFNAGKLKKHLVRSNSKLAESPYFETIVETAKAHGIDPRLLFAIAGQEQSLVQNSRLNSARVANNPFNVYGSWKRYNTSIDDSSEIVCNTIVNRLAKKPKDADPFIWLNRTYAADMSWHEGVRTYYRRFCAVSD